MTSQQRTTIAHIEAQHEAQRFQAEQAIIEGAALSGQLGIDAQIIALGELYKELLAQGDIKAARAVRAQAAKLYEVR
jgi:hypothetical protein